MLNMTIFVEGDDAAYLPGSFEAVHDGHGHVQDHASGLSFWTLATASWPFSASPQISNCGSRAKVTRTPARTVS